MVPDEIKEQLPHSAAEALPASAVEQRIVLLRDLFAARVDQTVASVDAGIKLVFSNAITSMFATSLWIILVGFLLSLLIPVISLGNEVKPAEVERDSST